MKRKKRILIAATLTLTNTVFAQGNVKTLNNQFSSLFNKSSNYQNYKIVDKQGLLDLQQNVEDSIRSYKKNLTDNQALIEKHKQELLDVSQKLETTEQELKTSLAKGKHFDFLGIAANKNVFQTLLLALFVCLLLLVGVFYYRFKKCHVDTKDALRKLKDTDEEFEEFRKTSLDREQRIRRQLQDEINKNKVN